jgi:hypothetical protein
MITAATHTRLPLQSGRHRCRIRTAVRKAAPSTLTVHQHPPPNCLSDSAVKCPRQGGTRRPSPCPSVVDTRVRTRPESRSPKGPLSGTVHASARKATLCEALRLCTAAPQLQTLHMHERGNPPCQKNRPADETPAAWDTSATRALSVLSLVRGRHCCGCCGAVRPAP